MQQTETRIQMIKMVYEFKLIQSVHVHGFTAGKKNCGKSGLGHWAIAGHWAFGPLGRHRPWAAGPWACF